MAKKSLPIPSPSPTPNGDRWVEAWRTDNEVFYESEDGWASISLCLISDKDGRRWEWRGHEVIVGIDRRALAEEWEQSRADELSGFRPVSEPAPAPVPVREAGWHLGRDERRQLAEKEPEPEPVPDVPLEPAANTLYSGVPAEERRAFTRWLNG
jgi:hypothetical protein